MNGLFFDENENLIRDDPFDIPRFRSRHKNFESINNISAYNFQVNHPHHNSGTLFSLSEDNLSKSENHNQHYRLFRPEWNFTEVNLANSHLFYIRTKYSCATPRAKLVKVLDFHSSPSKQYVPRCTVLHRCDDESGCCEDVTHRCEPSKTQLVELYFHVIRSDIKNNITGGNAVGIERLTFLNHTQCECKPINYMPRSIHMKHPHHQYQQHRPPMRLVTKHNKGRQDQHYKCRHVIKCPQPFVQRFRGSDQRCICDCIGMTTLRSTLDQKDKDEEKEASYNYCLKIQEGNAKLDQFWARCIEAEECSEPICSFGLRYNRTESQCSPQRITNSLHHRIRHSLHHHHQQQQQQNLHHNNPRTSPYYRHYHPVW